MEILDSQRHPSWLTARNNRLLFLTGFILLVLSLFLPISKYPVYLEESRRAIISLEMILRNNLLVPTQYGELYYNKPPLWNWVIILAFKIFGNYSEFAIRFFNVLSFIGMGALMYYFGKRYVNERFGIYSAMFFLTNYFLLLFSSLLGGIDLFYSFLTVCGFLFFYHHYRKGNRFLMFFLFYLFHALGFLAKGLPSIAFIGLTLLAFMVYKRQIKPLLCWQHVAGIILFLAMTGGYFLLYHQYHDVSEYLKTLFFQASQRTAVSKTFLNLIGHLFVFPFEVLKNTLPAALGIIFVFNKRFLRQIKENDYLKFFLYVFLGNILLYWLSPGTRPRYLIMLYPLLINIFVFALTLYYAKNQRQTKIFDTLIAVVMLTAMVFLVVLNLVPVMEKIENLHVNSLLAFIAGAFIIFVFFKYKHLRIWSLLFMVILSRMVFNFSVLEHRAAYEKPAMMKDYAYEMLDKIGEKPVHIYGNTEVAKTTVFYLEKELLEVIDVQNKLKKHHYYFISDAVKDVSNYENLYSFQNMRGQKLHLIRYLGEK